MTNRKIKGTRVYDNIRAREFWDCSERNLCAVWLALIDMGESCGTVRRIDDEFHDTVTTKFRQDAADGVIDERFDRWLSRVGLTRAEIDRAAGRFHERLARAFNTGESYGIVTGVLQTDFIAVLYQLNRSLGYGRRRLSRVMDFVAAYTGDEKAEVAERLRIYYPSPDELPDVTELYRRKREDRRERERANALVVQMLREAEDA